MGARAVIFDFDGTVADSEPTHERAIRAAIAPLGWDLPHERFAEFVGTSDRHCFTVLAREHGLELTEGVLADLLAAKREAYFSLLAAGDVRAYPGARELMAACARVVPIAVCSGSRSETVRRTLDVFGVLNIVRTIVGADDVSATKPDPEGYLLTCVRLGVSPASAVALEDTDHGIAAALAAGVRVIGVAQTVPAARLGRAERIVARIADITAEELLGGVL
jgi:beta-phosphoglucomutase